MNLEFSRLVGQVCIQVLLHCDDFESRVHVHSNVWTFHYASHAFKKSDFSPIPKEAKKFAILHAPQKYIYTNCSFHF